MPEGDTIVRIATALRPDLVGHEIKSANCRWEGVTGGLAGTTVEGIDTLGKHMIIRFDDDTALRVHLGLHGSWHRYDPGERWKKPLFEMACVLETEEDVFVCFTAPTVERLRQKELAIHRILTQLGPDLLKDPDLDEIMRRTRSLGRDRPLSICRLDQHIAAGIGNVYKSDVLFLMELLPDHRADEIDDETWLRMWTLGRDLLEKNRDRPRATREGRGDRNWVYGRAGKGCLRCRTRILVKEEGEDGGLQRITFWCPNCQK